MKNKLLIALLLGSSIVKADDGVAIRTGFGTTTETRSALYSFTLERTIEEESFYKLDFGFWTDNQPGHSSAPFMGPVIGYHFLHPSGISLTPVFGILVMGNPDAVLGAPFNFTEELAIGYHTVSIGWKHISNAGTSSPNMGRDYLFLNLTTPISF